MKDNAHTKTIKFISRYAYYINYLFGLYRDIRLFRWWVLKVVFLILDVMDQIVYIYDDKKLCIFYKLAFAVEWTYMFAHI